MYSLGYWVRFYIFLYFILYYLKIRPLPPPVLRMPALRHKHGPTTPPTNSTAPLSTNTSPGIQPDDGSSQHQHQQQLTTAAAAAAAAETAAETTATAAAAAAAAAHYDHDHYQPNDGLEPELLFI